MSRVSNWELTGTYDVCATSNGGGVYPAGRCVVDTPGQRRRLPSRGRGRRRGVRVRLLVLRRSAVLRLPLSEALNGVQRLRVLCTSMQHPSYMGRNHAWLWARPTLVDSWLMGFSHVDHRSLPAAPRSQALNAWGMPGMHWV